jgi:hypothetical protein
LEECAGLCELPLKPWSKKREKVLLMEVRKGLLAQLKACQDPEALLLLVVLVLHSTITGQLLHAPSTALPGLVDALLPSMTREASAVVSHHWQLIQRLYTARVCKSNADNEHAALASESLADAEGQDSEASLLTALSDNQERLRSLGLEFKDSLSQAASE